MSFLAPWFLLGTLAVAAPVIFHLIRRTTRERTPFSSLLFLLPSPPRLTRRSRLENLLLLALRCAAIVLLALGFGRPFLKRPALPVSASALRQTLIVVDDSASMRRGSLWSDACTKAGALVRAASAGDQVALFTFNRELQPLVDFEQWRNAPTAERVPLALSRLRAASPGWGSTQLGSALIRAAELLADNPSQPAAQQRRIVVITDLQEGSHLEPLQGYEWPKGVEVAVEQLKPGKTSNASLQRVADPEELSPGAQPAVRVRVSNCADSRRDQLKVGWTSGTGQGFAGKPIDVYVPPGQSRIIALPLSATSSATNTVLLQGDDEAFDDLVYVIPPQPVKMTVLYLGSESEQDTHQPLYFLQRALQQTARESVVVRAHLPKDPLLQNEVEGAGLILVADVLPDSTASGLHDQLLAGKTALVVLRSPAVGPTLQRLLGSPPVGVEEANPHRYAMLADIDFQHPLFAPFSDPRFSDFTKVHFWKYRRLDASAIPAARVLARFDSGDPALVEVPVGKGRAFILTSGWQPEDSQLALSTKFVPLLYSFLEQTGLPDTVPLEYHVGDTVPLASRIGNESGPIKVQLPDGSELNLAAGETNFSKTMAPGIYTFGSSQAARRFAVNLDPAESRTTPLAADELERLGVPILLTAKAPANQAARTERLQDAELESRQKLWRWLVLGTIGVLLLETWLAGRTARRATALLSA